MNNRIEILEKLKDIFKMAMRNSSVDLDTITEETQLFSELGLTSVGILYVVIAIEEFFDIRFDDVGTSDFKTVGDVVGYIVKKTAE